MNYWEKYFGSLEKTVQTLNRMKHNHWACPGVITDIFSQDAESDCIGCRWLNRITGDCEAPSFSRLLELEAEE